MAIYNLQLLPSPGNYKKGTLFYGPRAWIALESYCVMELPTDSGKKKVKFHTISPECVTASEIEHETNRLIQELEAISKEAKRFFKRDEARARKLLSSQGVVNGQSTDNQTHRSSGRLTHQA